MRYHALATDYDGTVATDGAVDAPTEAALRRLRESGRKLLLVTGRELPDLQRVCGVLSLFDVVVAENGALLHIPATRETRALAAPPPPGFVDALRARGVEPLSVGQVIVATWRPHEAAVLDTIRALGLESQVIFNKGAVMVLPPGVNKATGLDAALSALGLSPHNAVGVGDAENDHAFLGRCELGVAVANALPTLKERADLVTSAGHGVGVTELIDRLLATDLDELRPALVRHDLPLGKALDGEQSGDGSDGGGGGAGGASVAVPVHGGSVLVAGTSGSGKSTLVTGLLERMAERGYQHCVIDPEGDYGAYKQAVALGNAQQAPTVDEVMAVLESPDRNVSVNLFGLSMEQRPPFFAELLPHLQDLRTRTGRPHFVVLDEAHHLFPDGWRMAGDAVPRDLSNLVLVTVHPEHVATSVLAGVETAIAVGRDPEQTLRAFAAKRGVAPPPAAAPTGGSGDGNDDGSGTTAGDGLPPGDALVWRPGDERPARRVRTIPPQIERQRHARKYADGDLGAEKSFYFRGPAGKLNLRAQNLRVFLQLAEGVDDVTWLHHLRQGDYSTWARDAIKDDDLAAALVAAERAHPRDAQTSRADVRAAIETRYAAPA